MTVTSDASRDLKAGLAVEVGANTPLPEAADYWCYPGGRWQLVERHPPFVADGNAAPPDFVLVASKNLAFAWVPPGAEAPLTLPHPADPDAVFYACDLTFLSWVRARCDRAVEIGYALTPEERAGVARVWAHIIAEYDMHDDDDPRIPEPGASLPPLRKAPK